MSSCVCVWVSICCDGFEEISAPRCIHIAQLKSRNLSHRVWNRTNISTICKINLLDPIKRIKFKNRNETIKEQSVFPKICESCTWNMKDRNFKDIQLKICVSIKQSSSYFFFLRKFTSIWMSSCLFLLLHIFYFSK